MPKVSRTMLTTLSEYLDLILKLDFPQTNLLKANKFLEYLKKDDLEYYDKSEVIRPVLRLYKPPIQRKGHKNILWLFRLSNGQSSCQNSR